MNAPIKLAALFAGALLVLAQTSGAAEAGHGRKQVHTAARQSQAVYVWNQHRSHMHGKAYGKRRHYANDAYRHGKAYGRRAQRRYAGIGQWQYQGWQYQGWQYHGWQHRGRQYQGWQHQAQRQWPRQNSDGRIAGHRQPKHIDQVWRGGQVWRGNQIYLNRNYGN